MLFIIVDENMLSVHLKLICRSKFETLKWMLLCWKWWENATFFLAQMICVYRKLICFWIGEHFDRHFGREFFITMFSTKTFRLDFFLRFFRSRNSLNAITFSIWSENVVHVIARENVLVPLATRFTEISCIRKFSIETNWRNWKVSFTVLYNWNS